MKQTDPKKMKALGKKISKAPDKAWNSGEWARAFRTLASKVLNET